MGTSAHASTRLDDAIRSLEDRFGMLITGRDLVHLLGYRTSAAFRQAVRRKTLGLSTFLIHGRRGRCARASDVARWAFECGALQPEQEVLKPAPDRPK